MRSESSTEWRRRAAASAAAAVLAILAGLALHATGTLQPLERQSVDLRFELRHTRPPADVAVVAVDDVSFDELSHQWPFPRSWHAKVVDRLRRAGARSVVYDVQFTEPSKPSEDVALYDALGRFPGAVLATSEMTATGATRVLGGDANLADIDAHAAASDLVDDADGHVDRVAHDVSHLRTIPVTVAEQLGHRPAPPAAFAGGGAWIDFRGPPGTVPTLSFADVYRGHFDPAVVRGRVIVVGASAPTLQDRHATPTSGPGLMSGPEIQANAIWTALHGFPLRDAPAWLDLLALAVLGAAPALARLRLRIVSTVLAAVVTGGLALAGAQALFAHGVVVAVAAPLATLALSTLTTAVASHLAESREKRWLARHNELLERVVRERTADLRRTQLEVLQRLAQAAELRDEDTGEHIGRLGVLAERLALALGLRPAEAELLRHASALHDVGKVGIPDRILLKPFRLDEEEWAIMRTHTTIGARVLEGSDSPLLQLAEEIARTHHERWDGTGYPAGLHGEEIPLSGRIVAVVDVFDALRSVRPYKEAWSFEDTVAELRRQRGRHFDPDIVDAFLAIAAELDEVAARAVPPWHATVAAAADEASAMPPRAPARS